MGGHVPVDRLAGPIGGRQRVHPDRCPRHIGRSYGQPTGRDATYTDVRARRVRAQVTRIRPASRGTGVAASAVSIQQRIRQVRRTDD